MPRRKPPVPIRDESGAYAWDRRSGETPHAYKAFRHYLEMGSERGLLKCAVELSRSRQLMTKWSSEHDWGPRALAYDSHMTGVELARKERVRAEYAERAERFRMESANANIDVASRLYKRCLEMLEVPLYEETIESAYEDGRPCTIIRAPTKQWDLKTAAVFAKAASDLAQTALFQMLFQEDDGVDVTKLSVDELREYVAKHGGQGAVKGLPAPPQSIES